MPIRWYGPADSSDPTYRHFERIVNLCLHGMLFAAVNSGLWFIQEIRHPWSGLAWITGIWFAGWIANLCVVIVLRPRQTEQTNH